MKLLYYYRKSMGMESHQEYVYISTTNDIQGFEVTRNFGLVFGATVRARGIGGDCLAGCQSTCGGEVSAYTEMAIEARNEAVSRMIMDARSRGANAVVGIRFDSDNMGGKQGSAANGTIVYGTAVLIEPIN
jgi:uncharacterized protein YbjQ (UPF0145 family)